jgi:hypothetical protein
VRILLYFIDALPGNRFPNSVADTGITEVDEFIRVSDIDHGTLFTNFYTGTPDTPRSLSAFFFGQESRESGFESRSDWPGHVSCEGSKSIFKKFIEEGFQVSFYLSEREIISKRFIPQDSVSDAQIFNSSNKKLSQHPFSPKDSLVFFQNNDYHFEIDDRYSHRSAFQAGVKRVFNHINSEINYEDFDHIIFFSDHGSRLSDATPSIWALTEDRVRCFLYVWSKNSRRDRVEESILSICDLHHYLLAMAFNQEESLEELIEERFKKGIIFEDYNSFYPVINSNHDEWGFIQEGIIHRVNNRDLTFDSVTLEEFSSINQAKMPKRPGKNYVLNSLDYVIAEMCLRSKSFSEFYSRMQQQANMESAISDSSILFLNQEKRIRTKSRRVQYLLLSKINRALIKIVPKG